MGPKANKLSDIRFRLFNLNFQDRELEHRFRMHYFKRAISTVRIALLTTIFIFGAFVFFDKHAVPDYFREFFVIRFYIITPFFALLLAMSYHQKFKFFWEELMLLAMLVIGGAMIYMVHRNPIYYYEGGIFIITAGGYLFIKLRFIKATIGGWLLFLLYNLVVFVFASNTGGSNVNILITNAFLISFNIICMIGLYSSERLERLNFIRQRELIQKQNEIEHINAELENKVQERTKDLMAAKEKAEESERLKSAFLANMSHEIRTPMNGILGFSELLTTPGLTEEEQQHFISVIHLSGQRLLNTVNDIVEISKIEARQVEVNYTDVDAAAVMEELIDFFRPEAEKKELDLTVSVRLENEDRLIVSDRNKLTSIFTNLIKNAIKYTDAGFIKVQLFTEQDWLIFEIADSGIGIPQNRIRAIFNRFEQADISDRFAKQGSGLGLAIAKSYIDMLDGKIVVESKQNKGDSGSVFRVSLPTNKEDNQ